MFDRVFQAIAAVAAGSAAVYANGVTAPENPTFTKDVAPILFRHCVTCHRPGDIGPMSLLSFDEARPWAKSIAKNVGERTMPPWHADPGIGKFKNDRSLADHEVATIVRWVEQGAKQGNPADMPPVPDLPGDEWRLGEPDLIVSFEEVIIPADGPDRFHDLRAKTNVPEDKWITAIEVRPGNRKVTHHVIIRQADEDGRTEQSWIGAWAAGMDPMVFPANAGRMLRKNATLMGDMHYHPTGAEENDATRIGLHFADNPAAIEKEVINLWIANSGFEIPAGEKDYRVRSSFTFPQDSYILGMLPHMHYRGKAFTYTARFPDGRREKLLQVSNYDFGWQTNYELEEKIFAPKGTRIECLAVFDNSTGNPRNPDPTQNVRFGNESFNEMMIGFVDYIVADGVRPASALEQAEQLGQEALAKGEKAYVLIVEQSDGPDIEGLLQLREGAATATWHLNFLGAMRPAQVTNVTVNGGMVRGRIAIPGDEAYDFEFTVDADGKVTGNIVLPPGADEQVLITGHEVKPAGAATGA